MAPGKQGFPLDGAGLPPLPPRGLTSLLAVHLPIRRGSRAPPAGLASGAEFPELGLWAGTQTGRIRPEPLAHVSAGQESAREPTSVIHLLEADSVGAQQVHDRRRFPSTLLPSTDMCRWFGPDPACLGSRPQPQLREAAPEARPAGGALLPRLIGECTARREASLLGGRGAAQPLQAESPACPELSEPPVQQSSRSSQKPDLAEFLSQGCSAMGETCPDLPCF